MHESDPDLEQWGKRTGERLRDAETQLPPHTISDLRSARLAAVAASERSAKPLLYWPLVTATGAFAAILAWSVFVAKPDLALPNMDDMEMAAAQESELLEDLDFVAWMLALEETDESPSRG